MRASRKRQILPPGDEPITPADLIERTKACERRRAWFARRRSKAAESYLHPKRESRR